MTLQLTSWFSLKRSTRATAICTLALAGCAKAPSDSTLLSELPGFQPKKVTLGRAYDEVSGKVLNLNCVTGSEERIGNTIGQVKYARNMGLQEILNQFSGGVNVSLPDWANFQAGYDFANETRSTLLSDSHSVFLSASPKSVVLQPQSLEVTSSAREILDSASSQDIQRYCGNEFVNQIDLGATLMATLKVDFASEEDKREFNANADIRIGLGESRAEIDGNLRDLSESVRSQTQITIQALQLGGVPEELFQILPDESVVCNLMDLTPCLSLFENIMTYAQSTFTEQLGDASTYNAVRIHTQPYRESTPAVWELRAPELSPADEPAFLDKMAALKAMYSAEKTYIAKAELYLREFADHLNTPERNRLEEIITVSTANLRRLDEHLLQCRRNPNRAQCFSQSPVLQPVDSDVLEEGFRSPLLQSSFAREPETWTFQKNYYRVFDPELVTETVREKTTLPETHLSFGFSGGGFMCHMGTVNTMISRSLTLQKAAVVEFDLSGFVVPCQSCDFPRAALLVNDQEVLLLPSTLDGRRKGQVELSAGTHTISIMSTTTRMCEDNQFVYLRNLKIDRLFKL